MKLHHRQGSNMFPPCSTRLPAHLARSCKRLQVLKDQNPRNLGSPKPSKLQSGAMFPVPLFHVFSKFSAANKFHPRGPHAHLWIGRIFGDWKRTTTASARANLAPSHISLWFQKEHACFLKWRYHDTGQKSLLLMQLIEDRFGYKTNLNTPEAQACDDLSPTFESTAALTFAPPIHFNFRFAWKIWKKTCADSKEAEKDCWIWKGAVNLSLHATKINVAIARWVCIWLYRNPSDLPLSLKPLCEIWIPKESQDLLQAILLILILPHHTI